MNNKRSIYIVSLFVKSIIMKKMLIIWLLSGMFFSATTAQYDDAFPTGYEGDNFSLEGAIDLFKNSNSLDQFERKLNTRTNWVNNLDLNFDGRTDYIRVEHKRQGDFHAVILQALVGAWDIQDVAVIEIEKVGRRDAVLQIIGDEDLYGEEIIVEAYDRNTLVSRGRDYRSNFGNRNSYVNVYNWSPIQFMFGRRYVRYVSPFSHHYYPSWWSPWDRCGYDVFRPRVRHYHTYYRPVRIHRVKNVHHFYKPHRAYSHTVLNNTNKVRAKHGKKKINRPKFDRNRVKNERGVTSKSPKTDRGNTRNGVKSSSDRSRASSSKPSRTTKAKSEKNRKSTRPSRTATSPSTGKRADRGSVKKTTSRGNSRSTKAKQTQRSDSKYGSRNTTKTKSQTRTRTTSAPSRSKKSSVKKTTKKSSVRKSSKSKINKSSRKSGNKRRQ